MISYPKLTPCEMSLSLFSWIVAEWVWCACVCGCRSALCPTLHTLFLCQLLIFPHWPFAFCRTHRKLTSQTQQALFVGVVGWVWTSGCVVCLVNEQTVNTKLIFAFWWRCCVKLTQNQLLPGNLMPRFNAGCCCPLEETWRTIRVCVSVLGHRNHYTAVFFLFRQV